MKTKITTQRLTLSPITEDDYSFMLALVNTKGWLEFIGDRKVHSKEDAIKYIQKIKKTEDLNYWIVRLKNNNTSIGIISFLKRSYLENFDIGFAFLPEFYGYGYAYEAAKEILSVVSKKPEHAKILATTVPQNTNSIKLLTKLGFYFEKEIEIQNEKLHVYSN
jgi:[ribosomal protein S5]-alanine N-acetyltransferase